MARPRTLSADEVRLRWDPSQFDFEDTSSLDEPDRRMGQDHAVAAIEFALGVGASDFHLFAAGEPGTGKATVVKAMARRATADRPTPPDLVCVYDFEEPEQPRVLRLPAGDGRVFAHEMSRLVEHLRKALPAALASRDYRRKHQTLLEKTLDARRDKFESLETRAREIAVGIEDTEQNIQLVPLLSDGSEMSEEQYDALDDDEKKEIEDRERSLRDDILEYLDEARQIQESAETELRELERVTATRVFAPRIKAIRRKISDPAVAEYLDAVAENIVETLEGFVPSEESENPLEALRRPHAPNERFDVNVVVDNAHTEGGPVVMELNPTYANLVGKVERRVTFGALETNHTLVRAGALHRANGGILILDANVLLSHAHAYPALKRCLREGRVVIEDPDDIAQGMSTITLVPEPVEIEVQVVLIGSLDDYIVLRELDSEFAKLIKVRADFELSTELDNDIAFALARFVGSVCRERNLRHFGPDATAALVEYGSRLAGRKDELTLRLESLRDAVVEADYWAGLDGADRVERRHVERADEKMRDRSSLFFRQTLREFRRKNLLIAIEGERVGQVNGLAVIGVGDILFGMPARITAKTFTGSTGVVNIERETELSGQIHSKAVLILNGYLGWMYARTRPLALGASITFEQNYNPIEGDSASVAELVALLSSLSGLPVRQDLAVTGSMSQHGEVQPIGGINEKVEGFFRVCVGEGLTGTQGVAVPVQNVADLNLDRDVAEAVAEGRFHIYPIATADEALALLLSGRPGVRRKDGTFGPTTVHGRVERRLAEMSEANDK